MARPLRAVVVVALGLLLAPVARAAVIDADPDARRVQAAGTDLTWLSAPRVGDGDFAVTLRVRHGGRNVSAPGVPGRYSASAPEAYGDLGMDRSGRVVQVVGDSL